MHQLADTGIFFLREMNKTHDTAQKTYTINDRLSAPKI